MNLKKLIVLLVQSLVFTLILGSGPVHAFDTYPKVTSKVKVSYNVKDGYLNRACRVNLLSDVFYTSFINWQNSVISGSFVDQSRNRFVTDAKALQKQHKKTIRYLKKNKSKFPKSARKSIDRVVTGQQAEIAIIDNILNASNWEGEDFEWENFLRNRTFSASSSGQIRKSLKLPRKGLGCP